MHVEKYLFELTKLSLINHNILFHVQLMNDLSHFM